MTFPANPQQPLNGNNAFSEEDQRWMRYALSLAEQAEKAGEVPVGAVMVRDNQIVGEGYNRPIQTHDATAHAEVVALRDASQRVKNYRLVNTTLYVTLEPCLMCIGAIVHARVDRLVFGAYDLRAGAVVSVFDVLTPKKLNHQVRCEGGLLSEECAEILSNFFKSKRK